MIQNQSIRAYATALLMALTTMLPAAAQDFSHADSGWVKIWNGKDWSEGNIFSRVYGATAQPTYPPASTWQILYPGTDTAAIYASSASQNQGNIGTKKNTYSHYRMRVEGKFDVLGPNATGGDNAGITYHGDETAERMRSNWPRSIEFQMRQIETGAAFSIQQLTFDTKVTGNTYNPTGTAVKVCETGCNARNYNGTPIISNGSAGKTRWLRYELVGRGSDSALHIVNDTVVFRLSNFRIYNDVTGNKTPDGPWDHGQFGLQSEGALVKYRRWEIMEFPAGTPKGENYLHRFFLDAPVKGTALTPNSTFTIKWRTLGNIPSVNLEYSLGGSVPSSAWQSIGTVTGNPGTYDWKVPASVTGDVHVRISGPAWVGADSSNGTGATGLGKANPGSQAYRKPVSFSIEGKGEVVSHIERYAHLEIRDIFGRMVRDLAIDGANLIWDRCDAKGMRVRPGIFFVRLLGNGAEETLRISIL